MREAEGGDLNKDTLSNPAPQGENKIFPGKKKEEML